MLTNNVSRRSHAGPAAHLLSVRAVGAEPAPATRWSPGLAGAGRAFPAHTATWLTPPLRTALAATDCTPLTNAPAIGSTYAYHPRPGSPARNQRPHDSAPAYHRVGGSTADGSRPIAFIAVGAGLDPNALAWSRRHGRSIFHGAGCTSRLPRTIRCVIAAVRGTARTLEQRSSSPTRSKARGFRSSPVSGCEATP
jgi:hypothetical protein